MYLWKTSITFLKTISAQNNTDVNIVILFILYIRFLWISGFTSTNFKLDSTHHNKILLIDTVTEKPCIIRICRWPASLYYWWFTVLSFSHWLGLAAIPVIQYGEFSWSIAVLTDGICISIHFCHLAAISQFSAFVSLQRSSYTKWFVQVNDICEYLHL